jgi:hypothetical protein
MIAGHAVKYMEGMIALPDMGASTPNSGVE